MSNQPAANKADAAALDQARKQADRAQNELDQLRQKIARLEDDADNNAKAEAQGSPSGRSTANPEGKRTSRTSESVEEKDAPAASPNTGGDPVEELRREPMMAHLFDALGKGKDIGHYGRLVFAMVAHHFLSEEEMLQWLRKDSNFDDHAAQALLRQVEGRDYNPPRRNRILEWQAQQDFPILPNTDDPDCGNVYRNLKFPQKVYEHIEEYQEEKASAGQ